MTKSDVILIAGPTASGKSALAIQIAQDLDGVIVNADALQVFSDFPTLTAQPTKAEQARLPHKLYGYVEGDFPYSVGTWLRDISPIITLRTRPLVIVGGTGLYFQVLLRGLVDIPPIADEIHMDLQNTLDHSGLAPLCQKLEALDPDIMKSLDLNNPRRVLRALAVALGTKKPLSQWQSETPAPILATQDVKKIVLCPKTTVLDQQIAYRSRRMLEGDVIEEVRPFAQNFDPTRPANKAIGVHTLVQLVRGEITEDIAHAEITLRTRQYAKRQRSWLRTHTQDWTWITAPDQLGGLI